MSNLNGFLPILPESIIERTLIADYLLSQGYLLCDLQYLATENADRLFEKACKFAKQKVNEVVPDITLKEYSAFGFSPN
jgi:hypothetical protein